MIAHFYHLWAAGAWVPPAREHAQALVAASFPGQVTVSLVGPPADRAVARERMGAWLSALTNQPSWIESDRGFEQVTIRALHSWAGRADGRVLYAHTKGAHNQSTWDTLWRRSMTRHVVTDWKRCVALLDDGYEAVGCHYLRPENDNPKPVLSPFYGGNFWWATTAYIRRLPVVGDASPYDAEAWIGLADPHAYDLRPGWPHESTFLLDECESTCPSPKPTTDPA